MNGDQSQNEILRAIGSLEGTVNSLVDSLNDQHEDLKGVRITCQRFEDFREAQKDIPSQIAELKIVANDYQGSKVIRDEKYAKIDFLVNNYKLVLAVGSALYFILGVFGIAFSRGWVKWGI